MVSIEVLRTPWTSSETVRKDTDHMEGISLVDAKHESYLQLWRGRVSLLNSISHDEREKEFVSKRVIRPFPNSSGKSTVNAGVSRIC